MGHSNKRNSLKYLNFHNWVGFGVIMSICSIHRKISSDLSKVPCQRDKMGVQSVSSLFLREQTIIAKTSIYFMCLGYYLKHSTCINSLSYHSNPLRQALLLAIPLKIFKLLVLITMGIYVYLCLDMEK